MPLLTKSVQEKKTKKDGVRVCIMRRPGEDVDWDIWIPALAPSHDLLTEYHQNKVNWEEFIKRFTNEVLVQHREYLQILIDLAKTRVITILCWEETPEFCHRRLVAEECQKLEPRLKVTIR